LQSTSHFVFSCPLAQQVWQDFASHFHLSHTPSLYHVLFLWPSSSSSVLGRAYSFRLQAGHAVAIHTLWWAHTVARMKDERTTRTAISRIFSTRLARHFGTLSASPRWRSRLGCIPSSLCS